MQSSAVSADGLADFKTRTNWWCEAKDVRDVFRSEGAVVWFIRQNRERLEKEGVLIRRRGPAGDLVNVRRIGQVALQILREKSAA